MIIYKVNKKKNIYNYCSLYLKIAIKLLALRIHLFDIEGIKRYCTDNRKLKLPLLMYELSARF